MTYYKISKDWVSNRFWTFVPKTSIALSSIEQTKISLKHLFECLYLTCNPFQDHLFQDATQPIRVCLYYQIFKQLWFSCYKEE